MIWINGEIRESASVSVFDHGFTVGDGVFETIKTVNGQAFALTRHIDRLIASSEGMGLPLPKRNVVTEAVAKLLQANSHPVGRLRVTWTSGSGGAGSSRAPEIEPTLVITHDAASTWPQEARVATARWPRNERSPLMQLKTISYAENVLALAEAHDAGAEEAIFFNTSENLSEGTGSNVIVRIGDKWVTPPLSAGVLAGVTRALAIQWLGVEEADISRTEFFAAGELVLSSSTRDLQAVGFVDGRAVEGIKSEAVRDLISDFANHAAEGMDP